MHGGPSRSGIAHHNFKHGLYSTALPTWMAGDVQRALNNPHLVSSFEQIAVTDAVITSVLQRLQADPEPPSDDQAQATVSAFRAFQQTQHAGGEAMRVAFQEVGRQIDALEHVQASQARRRDLIEQLMTLFQQRTKLVDSEVRRRKDAQEMMLKSQVMAFVSAVQHLVATHVTDRQQRQGIVDGVRMLMAGPRA